MANVSLKTDFKNGDKLYDYQLNNNFAAIKAALEAMNKITWQDNEEGIGVSAYKGSTEEIEDRELIDGQLLYNIETGETYIDTYVDDVLKRINTGSGNVVAIQETEPTNEAVKLWIEEDTLDTLGSEIVNKYSESTELGYSADYINGELEKINTYSTDETICGTWLGKPLYRKVIDIGDLPDSTYKDVSTGLSNVNYIRIYGYAFNSSEATLPLPSSAVGSTYSIALLVMNTNEVRIQTGVDRSAYSGYVVVEYTKNEEE